MDAYKKDGPDGYLKTLVELGHSGQITVTGVCRVKAQDWFNRQHASVSEEQTRKTNHILFDNITIDHAVHRL